MVPVAGVPGWAVNDAKDRVTVYVAPGVQFRDCRSPDALALHIPGHKVIHFTATRKTTDEVVAKMRTSGHYDDPSYAFEDWITKKLPNIKEGERNIHMYTGHQIWPSVRKWQAGEWHEIPDSIKPYLSSAVGNETGTVVAPVASYRPTPQPNKLPSKCPSVVFSVPENITSSGVSFKPAGRTWGDNNPPKTATGPTGRKSSKTLGS
jgi:hypothetical protein